MSTSPPGTGSPNPGSPDTSSGTGTTSANPHRIEVDAVNTKQKRSNYAARVKVHPKRVGGAFRRFKWAVMIVTLAIYYFTPWLRWDRPGNAPDQAVLIDFQAQRFYFFFIEIWPQEFYYITGLLILAAFGLFLVNSVAGRVWCGYVCPQTVWVDLFVYIERLIEGDRNKRLRLDRAPWTAGKIFKRTLKHTIWALVGVATGGAWIFYFADAPTLAADLFVGQAPVTAYFSMAFFTIGTYLMGGLAREQVCIYMCPWPRIQGAMFDEDSLAITYRDYRGEPRGAHKKGDDWADRGDCIDCRQCVAACPMGIDIRDGFQLECIQCALCIDACDAIMDKVDRPRRLIAYESQANLDRGREGQAAVSHYLRPRTLIYIGLLVAIAGFMTVTLLNRATLEVNLIRDRNPVFVHLSDGSIRNGFTVRAINKEHVDRTLIVSIVGLDGAIITKGATHGDASDLTLVVAPDATQAAKFYVSLPPLAQKSELKAGAASIVFVIEDKATGQTITETTSFRGPK
jgi:cytochrome c oxidase accessory protein FixG